MSTQLRSEIISKIDSYLNGKSSDRDLEGWVVANLQRALNSGNATDIHLVNEIDASFIEMGEGIINQAELNARLKDLVREVKALP